MKIAVAGAGFVGLVTSVCMAKYGHSVVCTDSDGNKIDALRGGRAPFFEAEVEEMLKEYASRLSFTADPKLAYAGAEVIFLCVGTPERGDGYANLNDVYRAAGQIAATAGGTCTVVVKSTVPIGTNEKLERYLAERAGDGASFYVASNPEFLSQGTAVRDMLHGPRIVIGTEQEACREVLREVYRDFEHTLVLTDRRTAEMIKYASNNFLALKISYINEIANLCEIVGADVDTVAYGMGLDRRIGREFLRSGIGYGGSCFPKDTKALHWLARYHDYEIKTVKAAIEVNENQKLRLIKKARRYYRSLEGVTVAVLGLTFKPGTDDLREAPSLQNIPILVDDGALVRAWDPVGCERFRAVCPQGVGYCDTIEQAISGAELCLILTEWDEIKRFELKKYASLMKRPIVVDGRNCYRPENARAAGITYDSIGRQRVVEESAQ